MARRLPKDLAWTEVVLTHGEPGCSVCGKRMHVKEHRRRCVYTLKGPVCYVVPLVHCPDKACPNHHRRFGELLFPKKLPGLTRVLTCPEERVGISSIIVLSLRSPQGRAFDAGQLRERLKGVERVCPSRKRSATLS